MKQSLIIGQDGRGGTIYYDNSYGSISFYWEFGGGDCIAIIFLPTDAEWRSAFGAAAEQKDQFLEYIGAEIIRQKAPGCQARVNGPWLEIFK